jgi:competence protein ComEA
MRHQFSLLPAALAVLAVVGVATSLAAATGTVNLNTAGAEQLALLPRVGETVAARIVAFRDANGPFKAIEDLMLVEGIGERTFELMRPHVALSGETTLAEKVRVASAEPEAEE